MISSQKLGRQAATRRRIRAMRCPNKTLTKKWAKPNFAALWIGVVAQLVEHHNGIVGVRGSNPLGSTIREKTTSR